MFLGASGVLTCAHGLAHYEQAHTEISSSSELLGLRYQLFAFLPKVPRRGQEEEPGGPDACVQALLNTHARRNLVLLL